jgi:holo-[acyl-carrier protein] synthase
MLPFPGAPRKEEAVIVGVGIDLVSVSRLAAVLERRGERARGRFFTAAEAERCALARSPSESFAARFAAKEAFYKALGTGVGAAGGWTDVEVVRTETGAPALRLRGAAARSAAARGVGRMHVSLTHSGDTAAAVVVLEAP